MNEKEQLEKYKQRIIECSKLLDTYAEVVKNYNDLSKKLLEFNKKQQRRSWVFMAMWLIIGMLWGLSIAKVL